MSLTRRLVGVFAALTSVGCGGGAPSSPSSSAPPVLTNPATVASQTGCSATFTCPIPTADVPSVERITLSTGTSATCRAQLFRPNGSSDLAVEVTIRNPKSGGYFWGSAAPGIPTNPMGTTAGTGNAGSAGPFQSGVVFNDIGTPISTGLEFITVLTLYTFTINQGAGTVHSTCEVPVYGTVPRS